MDQLNGTRDELRVDVFRDVASVCNVCECVKDWRTGGGWSRPRGDVRGWMNGRELTFCSASSSSLLIFRSSSSILFGETHRETCVIAAVTSCRPVLGGTRRAGISHSRSEEQLITQQKRRPRSGVHVWEWGSGQWMEHFAAKNLPDVQLSVPGEESQIVFSPGNFLSDKRWPPAKNSLETKEDVLGRAPGLNPGAALLFLSGGFLIRTRTCLFPLWLCVVVTLSYATYEILTI